MADDSILELFKKIDAGTFHGVALCLYLSPESGACYAKPRVARGGQIGEMTGGEGRIPPWYVMSVAPWCLHVLSLRRYPESQSGFIPAELNLERLRLSSRVTAGVDVMMKT